MILSETMHQMRRRAEDFCDENPDYQPLRWRWDPLTQQEVHRVFPARWWDLDRKLMGLPYVTVARRETVRMDDPNRAAIETRLILCIELKERMRFGRRHYIDHDFTSGV